MTMPVQFGRMVVITSPSGNVQAMQNAMQQLNQQANQADGLFLSTSVVRTGPDAAHSPQTAVQAVVLDSVDVRDFLARNPQVSAVPDIEPMINALNQTMNTAISQVLNQGLQGDFSGLFQLTNNLAQQMSQQAMQPQNQLDAALKAHIQQRLATGVDAQGQPILNMVV
jgi:hypothetical protein